MNRVISLALILSFFISHTVFANIGAECTDLKGKTSPCTIENQAGNLVVTYKNSKNASLNKDIPGKKITRLTGGEYARRRVAESIAAAVLLAPVALFALFSKKKLENFGVEYTDSNGKPASFLIQTKPKYSMTVQNLLQTISGKSVEFQDNGKK